MRGDRGDAAPADELRSPLEEQHFVAKMAGSYHGVQLDPEQLIGAARRAGRRPAQRDTLYKILETY